jgi:TolB-like protein/Flp pilus assembly protein TadD
MKRRNGEDGPNTKLENVELDLSTHKILLHFQDHEDPLVIHFDTPARKFYFSLIALIISEMKNLSKPGFIHIRKHEKTLKLLDNALAGQHASETAHGMWEKIRTAWHYRLPDLEHAVQFKVLERDLIAPQEKGGKYRYECSDEECDTWASLFDYDLDNKWRFKFAVDSASLGLDDISLTLGDLRDHSAWQGFLESLSPVEELTDEPKEVREMAKSRLWYRAAVAAVTILIIFAAGVAIRNLYFSPAPPPAVLELPDKPSIVVLPFVNMSGDPDKEYFSDGITEELINTLAQLEGLRVISRTSAFYFKEKDLDIKTIGEKLKVDTVLEGSVRTEGNKVRISAQLVNVADDSHLWAGIYDREMKYVCVIQEEVSRAIVDKLKPQLFAEGDRRLAKDCIENVEAYKLYLQGRYFWNKMSYNEAIEHFEQALALDPNYALAYAGLADVYNIMAFYLSGAVNVKEYYIKAEEAALKALKLDDTLSEAHASLGILKVRYEWDWKGAERALKRAIELNPGNALAHGYYGEYLWTMGRFHEGVVEHKIGLELDPLSRSINTVFGFILESTHKADQAMEQYHKTLELYPNHPMVLAFLGSAYMRNGKHKDGIALIEKAESITKGKSPFTLGILGYAYGVAGKREEAQEILDEVIERSRQEYFSPLFIAIIYTGMGNKDKAFEWVDKAYKDRDPTLYPLKTVAILGSLHSDPRFTVMLKKMGLEE